MPDIFEILLQSSDQLDKLYSVAGLLTVARGEFDISPIVI